MVNELIPYEGEYETLKECGQVWIFKKEANKPSKEVNKKQTALKSDDKNCTEEIKMDNVTSHNDANGKNQTIDGITLWLKECIDNKDFDKAEKLVSMAKELLNM